VGDGINDAAAMAVARASLSMESGTGLTRSSATGQLVHDRLEVLPEAIKLCRGIRRRLRGNLVYAFGYNVAGMAFASAGMLHPVVAALIMLVSSFFVTMRAVRS
jgi:cation transport ATPase